jgi:predicted DNA-binding transcriptional regulator YafY
LATPGTVLGDLGLDRASESALTKLLLALPAGDRRRLAQARQKVLIDVATWRAGQAEAVPCLAALYDALRRERRVHLTYARADGAQIERLVNPLGLVAKGLTWYLVATVDDAEPRTYRVSRIVCVTSTDLPAATPPAFDLAAYWEQSKARLVAGVPRFPVRVRAHANILGDLGSRARWSRVVSIEPADSDGWSVVDMEFELEEDVCAFALSHGACLELLQPRHLRDRVAQHARAAAALYAR